MWTVSLDLTYGLWEPLPRCQELEGSPSNSKKNAGGNVLLVFWHLALMWNKETRTTLLPRGRVAQAACGVPGNGALTRDMGSALCHGLSNVSCTCPFILLQPVALDTAKAFPILQLPSKLTNSSVRPGPDPGRRSSLSTSEGPFPCKQIPLLQH